MAKRNRTQIDIADIEADIERFKELYNIPDSVWNQLTPKQKVRAIIDQMLSEAESEDE